MAAELPDALLAFVVENFESVYQLEILLHVRQHGQSSAEAVARALYMPPHTVTAALDALTARGLVERANGSGYRCAPRSPSTAALVDEIATRYSDYRVRIAGAIYSRDDEPRRSPVQSFAEAFRLRRSKDTSRNGDGGDHG
ncbi:MarR family transcriptional regulator [Myxococcota bacterium]|nr:MarR family transcriptional regulator [Myxococcota bacterium]